jgi:hypothetical protein
LLKKNREKSIPVNGRLRRTPLKKETLLDKFVKGRAREQYCHYKEYIV